MPSHPSRRDLLLSAAVAPLLARVGRAMQPPEKRARRTVTFAVKVQN